MHHTLCICGQRRIFLCSFSIYETLDVNADISWHHKSESNICKLWTQNRTKGLFLGIMWHWTLERHLLSAKGQLNWLVGKPTDGEPRKSTSENPPHPLSHLFFVSLHWGCQACPRWRCLSKPASGVSVKLVLGQICWTWELVPEHWNLKRRQV